MTIFSQIPTAVNKWKQDISPEINTAACVAGVQRRGREENLKHDVDYTVNIDRDSKICTVFTIKFFVI